MPRASAAQTMLPLGDQPEEARGWDQILRAAFADPDRASGFLSQAEEAVRAQPGDGLILLLAATAALLDRNPERAQVFLKRFSKRYVAIAPYHLLRALVLAEQSKLGSARSVLEAHGLTNPFNALQVFPGGWMRRAWLFRQHDRIFGRDKPVRGRACLRRRAETGARSGQDQAEQISRQEPAGPSSAEAPPGLPLIDVDIPFSAELDLAPLVTAMRSRRKATAAGTGCASASPISALAQGFDELLCLPHLRGIETFWYQVETVRKVLKQFRGRVLLADEVGLGKTIEAGMVLKEYLLRGMVDSVLVLAPASLVGQWREELETKFDIPCATTHDALLRSDPDRFWNQKMPDRFACAGASERTCRAPDRPQLRSSHR